MPEIAPGASTTFEAKLFAGPQEEHALEKTAPGLELVKDYGWLTIIAKPLFWLLEKLHSLLGNWGWAIVAVTVILKLIFPIIGSQLQVDGADESIAAAHHNIT